jgi:cytochrome c oxidase subunit 2
MIKAIVLIATSLGFSIAMSWIAIARNPQNQAGAPQIIEVSAKKYEFSPNEIHVRAGTKVTLKIHSEDETHGVKLSDHPEGVSDKGEPGLLFEEPNENGKVAKHVDQVIVFTAQTPGSYDFKCAKVCGFGHGRMKGTLIVEQ